MKDKVIPSSTQTLGVDTPKYSFSYSEAYGLNLCPLCLLSTSQGHAATDYQLT